MFSFFIFYRGFKEAENTVAMKIAISNADQVLDVADHNPQVCINTNGLTITDGISLGTIASMDSQYIYIDIPESNVAELYNKLQVDWKYNQFLYVHILNGSTNPDTVYNNETSKHTDFYNNENFLLCEIAKFKQIFLPKLKMSLLLMVQLYLNLIVLLKNIKLDIM